MSAPGLGVGTRVVVVNKHTVFAGLTGVVVKVHVGQVRDFAVTLDVSLSTFDFEAYELAVVEEGK